METKKEAAFKLFAGGYSPSSPEVKALGLKAHTRATYSWEYKRGKGGGATRRASGGESMGGIDETKRASVEAKPPRGEAEEKELAEDAEAIPEEVTPEEAKPEKQRGEDESIGQVDESRGKGGKEKDEGKEKKSQYEITVATEGIRCVVFLSLQTLALYELTAAKQAQYAKDGERKLTLGDCLDYWAEQIFKDRKLKLGLVEL